MTAEVDLEQKLNKAFTDMAIPGMAIIASRHGEVVYEKFAGYRHVARQTPVTAETIFGLASLTKSVVAVAVMILQDQGKLNVSDNVIKWLPELKQWNQFYKRNITIHHLLTHTAGFSGMGAFHLARRESIEHDPDGDYLFGSFSGPDYVYSVQDLLVAMIKEDAPFIGKPGEVFNYSNESYALLQEIVERASGEEFALFADMYIFDPLEMEHAIFTFDDLTNLDNLTELYAFTKETPKEVFHSPAWWASGSIYGVGALKASAIDVQKYLELFRQNGLVNGVQIVSTESMEAMQSVQITTPNGVSYGYGLVVGTYQGQHVVGHGGGVKGISSFMLATTDLTVTVLTNIAEVPAEDVAFLVLDEWLKGEPEKGSLNKIIPLSDGQLQQYVGYYETNERQSVEVSLINEGLRLHIQHQSIDVKPIGKDQFILPDGKKVTFIIDEQGAVRGIFRGMRFIQKRSEAVGDESE